MVNDDDADAESGGPQGSHDWDKSAQAGLWRFGVMRDSPDSRMSSLAVPQLLWPGKDREEWFSLGENHEGRRGSPDFLRAALTEGTDVRLSSRKAACSSMAPPSFTGNPGSVYTDCENRCSGCYLYRSNSE